MFINRKQFINILFIIKIIKSSLNTFIHLEYDLLDFELIGLFLSIFDNID